MRDDCKMLNNNSKLILVYLLDNDKVTACLSIKIQSVVKLHSSRKSEMNKNTEN